MAKINGRVLASAAIQQAYTKKLKAMVDDMDKSVKWWLEAIYKKNEPIIAADSASNDINDELKRLTKQWNKKYDAMAEDIADWFVKVNVKHSHRNLQALLVQAGFTVKIKLSRRQRDKLNALTLENVNLIKSIPKKYFTDLTTVTLESITRGRDLSYLRQEIQKRHGVAYRRSVLIARDQNNKATSIITHMKYEELGITEAIWKHNSGAKEPRFSHLAANNKIYKIDEGLFFEKEGRHIFPGEEINCGCTSVPIIPELREQIIKKELQR